MQNVEVQRYTRALAFIKPAFANKQNPKLKKYMFITFGFLLPEMMDTYDLSLHAEEFAEAYWAG